ncbi:hypothetical protein NDU88_006164 [Pleurodeles waltl]|uniref:Uncharacterized protein n=1 Tax=Pleurodeles waltl TaxID=8319 RepID=A0AAV7VNY0_PLEWA|nr:hypothetical protein NDU88_006164 [Pleurodeles waltl]
MLHAAPELRKTHRAASHVTLRGITGRVSISGSRAAVNPVKERLLELEAPEPYRTLHDASHLLGSTVESAVRKQLRGLPPGPLEKEKEPRGHQKKDDNDPEVIPNPDIRVEAASARGENGLTGREDRCNGTEPEERRVTEPEERRVGEPEERRVAELEERRVAELEEKRDAEPEERRDPSKKQLGKDLHTETSTTTDGRHSRTRHVPGGA